MFAHDHAPRIALLCIQALFVISTISSAASPPVHHELSVTLDPALSVLTAVDTITLEIAQPNCQQPLQLLLHPALIVETVSGGRDWSPLPEPASAAAAAESNAPGVEPAALTVFPPVNGWPAQTTVTIAYAGKIHHEIVDVQKEYARSSGQTPGIICADGVNLSGASHWYPIISDELVTFSLTVKSPAGWTAISQGARSNTPAPVPDDASAPSPNSAVVTWNCPDLMDEIHLIAGAYTEYVKTTELAEAQVFLRASDPALAQRYLDATEQYLRMYSELLGPYPYPKFALVENFWETGYGMPSFTLLGPSVVRLPFIIRTSYPHEILHNWWGNSVFVDYSGGNWCEGLTAYLADHLMKEIDGQGAEHRRDTLQRYEDYARGAKDFPLTEFTSRHSSATEAVGYGKSMMFFHMLRRELGDETFSNGLRQLYRQHRGHRATFTAVIAAFSHAAGKPLDEWHNQWIERTGAPALALDAADVEIQADSYLLRLTVRQTAALPPYHLRVPVAVVVENQEQPLLYTFPLDGESAVWELTLAARPLAVAVDPEFDLFRHTDRREIPASLSQTFGADQALIVLPAAAAPELSQAYRDLAEKWRAEDPEAARIVVDAELNGALPEAAGIWLLGRENLFAPQLLGMCRDYGLSFSDNGIRLGQAEVPWIDHSFVITARHPERLHTSLTLLTTAAPAAVPALGRKIPHYGKYGYLAFSGKDAVNVVKGQWPPVGSPLVRVLDAAAAVEWTFPARAPLATLPQTADPAAMLRLITELASDRYDGRGLGSSGLDLAAELIAGEFAAAGLRPAGDNGGWFQEWRTVSGPDNKELALRNIVGILPGANPDWAGQSVVIGAHYDHLGRGWPDVRAGNEGQLHPGADDNASGVAALIELARRFAAGNAPPRALVFVAFTGEEAGRLGSKYFIEHQPISGIQQIRAMVNLDQVGRLGTGKLLVLGAGSAREWPGLSMGCGYVAGLTVEAATTDLDASDQVSFIEHGIPAVQLFAGVHLDAHRPSDTADLIDGKGLIKIVHFAQEMIHYLATRNEPLTGSDTAARPATQPDGSPALRKTSLGTVPDFAHQGGYRLAGVVPGSPAAAAGLQAGDEIVSIGGLAIAGIKDVAAALAARQPGDNVEVVFRRDGREDSREIELVAR